MHQTPAKTRNANIAIVARWLQVSRYDRASSLLLALLVTVGSAAALLFVVWLTGKLVEPPKVAAFPTLLPPFREGGDGRAPGGSQLDTPSNEPVVGHDKKTANVEETLETLDLSPASKIDALDDLDALRDTRHGSKGSGDGTRGGDGPGSGVDPRIAPLENHDPPRHWEVVFSRSTLDAYARELDFFKIELAVLLPDNRIIYAHNLAKSKPDTRVLANPAASENRYYLTWRNGEMQQADRELLARAEVEAGDHLIVKFLPPQTEAQLVQLEKRYAGADPRNIRRTRFGVHADGNAFKFYVLEQSLKR
jgi:hypothetical protein